MWGTDCGSRLTNEEANKIAQLEGAVQEIGLFTRAIRETAHQRSCEEVLPNRGKEFLSLGDE